MKLVYLIPWFNLRWIIYDDFNYPHKISRWIYFGLGFGYNLLVAWSILACIVSYFNLLNFQG